MEQKYVEVFKTNLKEYSEAEKILELLHQQFPHYKANVDLSDCDRILRIECTNESVDESIISKFIADAGYVSEVLPD